MTNTKRILDDFGKVVFCTECQWHKFHRNHKNTSALYKHLRFTHNFEPMDAEMEIDRIRSHYHG